MHRKWNASAVSLLAAFACILAGCGTAVNDSPSAPTGTLQPQSLPATGPTLGYIWDAAGQALRPVRGVPGASIVGAAAIIAPTQGPKFIAAASSARSSTALFLDADGSVFQSPLSGGKLSQVASVPGATKLILSSSGAYALVTGTGASGSNVAAVISGLQTTPATQVLDVSTLSGVLGGAASDTGTVVLAAASSANGVSSISVFGYVGKQAAAPIATLQSFGGMQFVPGSDELIVADGTTGAFTAISKVNTAPAAAPVPSAVSISAPIALDITPDARWMVAANRAGDVLRVDLTAALPSVKTHCACTPGEVSAMSGTTFRLVAPGSGPLWIVAAGGVAPRVLFVPAITTAPTDGAALKKSS